MFFITDFYQKLFQQCIFIWRHPHQQLIVTTRQFIACSRKKWLIFSEITPIFPPNIRNSLVYHVLDVYLMNYFCKHLPKSLVSDLVRAWCSHKYVSFFSRGLK